ncbi:MAG TPA: carboxypeptidase-like regulatory domain-containing protein [Bryobacteraceae bacterium]|nr:carboxypeptidase-like regulatory domain-containing protein [Bryobacteraceae bacterium]
MRLALLSLLCSAGLAQEASPNENTGAIAGKVVDDFGVPVADAAVVAKNNAGQESKTTANAVGEYMLDKLAPGAYQVTVTMVTMKKFDQSDFAVKAAKTSSLDVTLHQDGHGTLGDGDRFTATAYGRAGKTPPSGPTPRLADGTPDLSGFWARTGNDGPPAPQLRQPDPFPWAEAIRKERQASQMRDHPFARCLPNGVINRAGEGKFVHTPTFLAMLFTEDPPRQIFLDGRPHPKNPDPNWLGHSIGHWEGDTLVVDTVGFNGLAWYGGGLPSTENLHVVERYTRTDLGHLELEITIEDPAVLRTPWTQKRKADLDPHEDVEEYVCTENNKDVEHMVGK